MNPSLHAHVKHVLIAVLIIGGSIGGLAIRDKFEAYKVDRMAKRDEQIAANQATVAAAQKTIQTAEQSNQSIDAQTKAQIAQLQAQLAAKPDSAQIRAIVEASLPGVRTVQATDAQGNAVIAVADTQANRDAINKAQVDFKTCNLNLGDCQQKQANFQQIIQAQDTQLSADKSTIDLQNKDIEQLRKLQVPRWTLMVGAGKTQGASFNNPQNYQPLLGLDYRLSSRFGIFGLAQNKSAAAGLSYHFGGTK